MQQDSTADSTAVAVVGDVHLQWNDFDVDYFNRSDYDLILFVGDVAAYSHRHALPIARSISRLTKPALLIPGNHDAIHLGQLVAEALERPNVSARLGGGQRRRTTQIDRALGGVELAGYSRHLISTDSFRFSVVAGRPNSMGGDRVAFRRHLRERYGIETMDDSRRRLIELVEQCDAEPIVFLAHNGPTGCGNEKGDLWGCDFRPDQGDFGDPDLEAAIAHAGASGRQVIAVVAGHMHHALKGGGQRKWWENRGGVLYLNAARVPRIYSENGQIRHHHVELRLSRHGAECFEREIAR